jgi:hypothetical protein
MPGSSNQKVRVLRNPRILGNVLRASPDVYIQGLDWSKWQAAAVDRIPSGAKKIQDIKDATIIQLPEGSSIAGGADLDTVVKALLEAVNKRLSAEQKITEAELSEAINAELAK